MDSENSKTHDMTPHEIYNEFNECQYKEEHFDTWLHKYLVSKLLLEQSFDIQKRSLEHDNSKMTNDVEIEGYGRIGPKLSTVKFGSNEFNQYKEEMQPAIDHHMCNNRHHVESHENGIKDMNLIDLLEMLADWKAAGSRRSDSTIENSINRMNERYQFGDDIVQLLRNTADYLNY